VVDIIIFLRELCVFYLFIMFRIILSNFLRRHNSTIRCYDVVLLFSGRHVAPHGHIIVDQSLIALLNAACLAEKQQIPI
jgi:hypothetical protein